MTGSDQLHSAPAAAERGKEAARLIPPGVYVLREQNLDHLCLRRDLLGERT